MLQEANAAPAAARPGLDHNVGLLSHLGMVKTPHERTPTGSFVQVAILLAALATGCVAVRPYDAVISKQQK